MKFLAIFIIALLFAGCSTTLMDEREIVESNKVKTSFEHAPTPQKSADSTERKLGDFDALSQISFMLNDDELSALFERALAQNTSVLTQISRIEQARASATTAGANMLPSVSGSLSQSYSRQNLNSLANTEVVTSDSLRGSFNLSWELDLFGRLNALRGAARENFLSAESTLLNTQITLLSDIATNFYALKNAMAAEKIAKTRHKNAEQVYEIMTLRFSAGLSTLSEKTNALNSLNSELSALNSAKLATLQTLHALRILLDDMNFKLSDSLQNSLQDSSLSVKHLREINPDTTPAIVLLKRPDIKTQIHNLNAQMYRVTAAKAARLPSLSLSASISQILSGNANVGNLSQQIAGNLSLPLLNRTNLRQNQIIEEEGVKQAIYTLQNAINTATSEVESAFFNLNKTKAELASATLTSTAQSEQHAYNLNRHELGLIDTTELLNSQNAALSAKRAENLATLEHIKSYINAFKALGGLVYAPADEHEIPTIESAQQSRIESQTKSPTDSKN